MKIKMVEMFKQDWQNCLTAVENWRPEWGINVYGKHEPNDRTMIEKIIECG